MKTLFLTLCFLAPLDDGTAAEKISPAMKKIAGEYYFGDGLDVNCILRVDAVGGFKLRWYGCLGLFDENHGDFTLQDGVLVLTPKKINVRGGFRGLPTEFFHVVWGPRSFLVPTNAIIEFCSDVNQGIQARSAGLGRFYFRKGDIQKAVASKPEVPAAWEDYLLKKPVSGSVTDVIGSQEAWVDRGSRHGILPGMILTARGGSDLSPVRVEAVEKNRCRVKCRLADSELFVGQSISSRSY